MFLLPLLPLLAIGLGWVGCATGAWLIPAVPPSPFFTVDVARPSDYPTEFREMVFPLRLWLRFRVLE